MKKNILDWAIRAIPTIILLQTLFYKFTGAPESVHIFSALGAEPYGRIGLGIAELITALLLLIPKTAVYGAIACLFIMTGAIASHIFVLGIEVSGDGGTLFILACVTFFFSGLFLIIRKKILNYPS
ncbi:DoxX family protein [Sinomicrobium pectinilyticum]|uniref:DoxX family protein n=1 Tax=Sinomicrobium pectinilyticum TaxID=1084421 RepID=A0A3N0F0H4_SINP1|nr:DoxX family protein [Sinomicrobium pectinilyticum]RNL93519.1 DoxX family protein [Sinomicrobium pectinilyticum]